MSGKLIIITAPSGAGKTTIVKHLLAHIPSLRFSVSATTRSPRANEADGIDYYFISETDFKKHIAANHFLEWEEVYPGRFYGTLQSEVERLWSQGMHVVFDIDVIGAIHLQEKYPAESLSLFIAPPSLEILEQRLMLRKTESPQMLQTRMERAAMELSKKDLFDMVIVNDNLDTACRQAHARVLEFISG
ncbi:MAG: guanylate kinase [Chitinophagales bacterium]